jgi:hypothetical protein
MRIVHHQRVTLSSPLESLDEPTIAARTGARRGRQSHSARVRLKDPSGVIAFDGLASIPRWKRVETRVADSARGRAAGEPMAGHVIAREMATFVVRVPIVDGASQLEIQADRSGGIGVAAVPQTFDLDAIEAEFASIAPIKIAAEVHEAIPGHTHGPSNNRLDVLYISEGYTNAGLAAFRTNTNDLAAGFVGEAPLTQYAKHINQWRLFVPSAQSGADRPWCPDDPSSGDLDDETFVNTAFDAAYCEAGIWRLLGVNDAKVLAAAADYPDWDMIVVLVRSPIRGGSGGSMAVTSLSPNLAVTADIIDVVQHEFGHSFANLADEYVDPIAAQVYPPCSDLPGTTLDSCEPNVTDQTSRASLKWKRWVASTTAVPTPDLPRLSDALAGGLWEGARYFGDEMYRQCFDGKMRNSGRPFCRVDGEALLLQLYQGGWGAPVGGISTIEPGTRSPAAASMLVNPGQNVRLQAKVFGPVAGPSLRVEWFINSSRISDTTAVTGSTPFFDFAEFEPGMTTTITLKVTDRSTLMHSTMRGVSTAQASWTITVRGGSPGCPTCPPK